MGSAGLKVGSPGSGGTVTCPVVGPRWHERPGLAARVMARALAAVMGLHGGPGAASSPGFAKIVLVSIWGILFGSAFYNSSPDQDSKQLVRRRDLLNRGNPAYPQRVPALESLHLVLNLKWY